MKLYTIISGDKECLLNKKYNIGVGVSLGNKWFTIENITELVKWSLEYTRDNVIVYVADSIHAINLEVRNRISFEKSQKKADLMGTKILNDTKIFLQKALSSEEFVRVKFVKWSELVDNSYKLKLDFLHEKYKTDSSFKNDIHTIVINSVSKEERIFSDEEINRLGEYLIEEMPEVLCRVKMAGFECDAYTYPFNGEFVIFIGKLQNGEIYPEIKETIMDTDPKVFLEVR